MCKCLIISSHATSSNNICAFHLHFSDQPENIIRISTYLIDPSHLFLFHGSSHCFLQSPVFIFDFFSIIFCHCFMCFSFPLYPILFPLIHHYVSTLHFMYFIYPHTSSQAISTPSLKEPHKSWLLSNIIPLSLHSKSCM